MRKLDKAAASVSMLSRNDLPLAWKLTLNNNPNLSNGKGDISKKNAINMKSVLTVQQSQFVTSDALTTRI
jgi:hypothetical protein